MRLDALRPIRLFQLLAYGLVGLLLGCGGGGGPTAPAGLPDPGLSNVATENEAARGATIGAGGGTVVVTGSNGAQYTLTIPPGALTSDREIGLYPISSLATLPAGGSTVAGVHFVPEGLTFDLPAELSIKLPAAINPDALLGLAYEGNGTSLGLDLTFIDGQTITMPVLHFSGKALGARTLESLIPEATGSSTRADILDGMVRIRERQSGQEQIDRFSTLLGNWYDLLVKPAFRRIPLTDGFPSRPFPTTIATIVNDPAVEYDQWLDGILYASQVTGQPQSTFAPDQQAEGESEAVEMLRALYSASMEFCKDDAVANPTTPVDQVNIATRAISLVQGMADLWALPRTNTNRLSEEALRADSCIQCQLVEPSINQPQQGVANDGLFRTRLGFSIDGAPIRHDLPMRLRVVESHTLAILTDRPNPGAAEVRVPFTWANGVDPYELQVFGVIEAGTGPIQLSTGTQVFRVTACNGITVSQVTPGGVAGFSGQVTIFDVSATGSFDQYEWSFGGGATTDEPTFCCPQVTLGEPGTYTGTVTLRNSTLGCAYVHEFQYTVSNPPDLPFTSRKFSGIINEVSAFEGVNCSTPASAEFVFGTSSGFPEFQIEYLESCDPRALGQVVFFPLNQAAITETTFATRDELGTGTYEPVARTIEFEWTSIGGGATVVFIGNVQE